MVMGGSNLELDSLGAGEVVRLSPGNPVQNLCSSAANGNTDNAAILNTVDGVEDFSDVMELSGNICTSSFLCAMIFARIGL